MDEAFVIRALSALAQPHRLRAYAFVAAAGDAGTSPGEVARALAISKNLLTGHLALLVDAGLLVRVDHGRSATLKASRVAAAELLRAIETLLAAPPSQT